MHDEQELTQAGTPEAMDTDGAAAEFEALIQGRCKQPFQARVQKILDGRLRTLRQENETLRRQAEEQHAYESGCVARLAQEAEAARAAEEPAPAPADIPAAAAPVPEPPAEAPAPEAQAEQPEAGTISLQ